MSPSAGRLSQLPEMQRCPKLDRSLLKDQAADTLRTYISTGRIPEGTRLTEREVSHILGISRMPAREALQALEAAYTVMSTLTESVLSEYVMVWFSRKESDRLGWYMSDASIRSNLDLDRFFEIEIPVPSMPIQKAIAEIYAVYNSRRAINEKLKAQLNAICPILIRGSLLDGG